MPLAVHLKPINHLNRAVQKTDCTERRRRLVRRSKRTRRSLRCTWPVRVARARARAPVPADYARICARAGCAIDYHDATHIATALAVNTTLTLCDMKSVPAARVALRAHAITPRRAANNVRCRGGRALADNTSLRTLELQGACARARSPLQRLHNTAGAHTHTRTHAHILSRARQATA